MDKRSAPHADVRGAHSRQSRASTGLVPRKVGWTSSGDATGSANNATDYAADPTHPAYLSTVSRAAAGTRFTMIVPGTTAADNHADASGTPTPTVVAAATAHAAFVRSARVAPVSAANGWPLRGRCGHGIGNVGRRCRLRDANRKARCRDVGRDMCRCHVLLRTRPRFYR